MSKALYIGRKFGSYFFSGYLLMLCIMSCADDNEVHNNLEPTSNFIGELEWVKNYGGSGEETAQSVINTQDGGYAILGYTNSTDGDIEGKTTAVNDYWLLKLDASGEMQWNRTYGGSKDDRGQSLVQTADGGYALTGYAMSSDGDGSSNQGFHDNWIIKLDALGSIEWEKSFGFSGHDHSYDILQTPDGGYLFVGFLDVTSARSDGFEEKGNSLTRHGVGEFWCTKLDAEGNLMWRQYFGGTNNDRAHAVVPSEDGGFVMAGFSESNDFDIASSRGSYDFWVLKINGSGEMQWERSFGGTGIEIAQDITKTGDGAYVIVGNTFSTDRDISTNNGESDIWMIKINDQGELLWERTMGGSGFEDAQGVTLTRDGGFLISGNSKSTDKDTSANAGENDLWVVKTNAKGMPVWQKSFGGSGLDFGFDAIENDDYSILVVGQLGSYDMPDTAFKGMTDLMVLKLK